MAENNDVRTIWVKNTLMVVTTLLALSSAFIIPIGVSIVTIYYDVAYFLYHIFTVEAFFTIAMGVIIMLVSIFGFIAAVKESICMVNWFAVILSAMLALEMYAVFHAYSMRGDLTWFMSESLQSLKGSYYSDSEIRDNFDLMHRKLRCCGMDGYMDWKDVSLDNARVFSMINYGNLTVPHTCCNKPNKVDECFELYNMGCMYRVKYWSYQTAILLGSVVLIVAVIQIIGILSSFSLVRFVRRSLNERKNGYTKELFDDYYTPGDIKFDKKESFACRLISIGSFSLVFTKDLV